MADLTVSEMRVAYPKVKKHWFPSGEANVSSVDIQAAANSISNWIDKAATVTDYHTDLHAPFDSAVATEDKKRARRDVIAVHLPT